MAAMTRRKRRSLWDVSRGGRRRTGGLFGSGGTIAHDSWWKAGAWRSKTRGQAKRHYATTAAAATAPTRRRRKPKQRRGRALWEVEGGARRRTGGAMAVRTKWGVFSAVDRFFKRLAWSSKRNRRRSRTISRRR